ncbi:protoporphyrinogen oxidase HemJ [Aestuariirhabdus litorea]|uniref:Protoporphyrinogen IX oxidase n=1 Tax=Aestuariirhabdus litorea TaxID=2528527 RepID=A0A3P3VLZ9_9GAMM|nr:protoporphyrinogen oxidase HemJ [Aestuariirhabdus litorea]RRJ83454.1 protoporphyrinogen oxidase HemJ [Aestuariirhabdus litorea]RWW93616.1 protoporphyrinogen oxidase HemJ [Endozoicomonadaceae bacterium GTF-13]
MLWVKAFHIIAVICWFAALFYLPRLFVYHAMSEDEISRERFKVMERKLYRGIGTPSMLLTLVLGFWLVSYNHDYYEASAWFHAKLTLVALLVIYHFLCGRMVKTFAADANTRSHVYYRWFNEVPVLMLVGIVVLVVVRPF